MLPSASFFLKEPLPPPIHRDNYQAMRDVCLLGDKFKALATDVQAGKGLANNARANRRLRAARGSVRVTNK